MYDSDGFEGVLAIFRSRLVHRIDPYNGMTIHME